MPPIVYMLVQLVYIFLDVMMVAMLLRAILSWFAFAEWANRIGSLLYVLTEPLIWPVRSLFNRFGWFEGLPLDIPFFVTSLLLMVLRFLLNMLPQ